MQLNNWVVLLKIVTNSLSNHLLASLAFHKCLLWDVLPDGYVSEVRRKQSVWCVRVNNMRNEARNNFTNVYSTSPHFHPQVYCLLKRAVYSLHYIHSGIWIQSLSFATLKGQVLFFMIILCSWSWMRAPVLLNGHHWNIYPPAAVHFQNSKGWKK